MNIHDALRVIGKRFYRQETALLLMPINNDACDFVVEEKQWEELDPPADDFGYPDLETALIRFAEEVTR